MNPDARPTDDEAEQLNARGIVVVDAVAALEVNDDRLAGVRLDDGMFVDLDAVAVMPHMVARAQFLRSPQR